MRAPVPPRPTPVSLHLQDFPLPRAQRAVLIVHGLGEHMGRYQHMADWFNQRGYSVRGYDHYGHGHSPGPRGSITDNNMLLDDLRTQFHDYQSELGYSPILLGHSMGGLVAAAAVTTGWVQPRALVLSSPALRTWISPSVQLLAHVLALTVPDIPLWQRLPNHKLSHDPQVTPTFLADPLRHGRMTPRLAYFLMRGGREVLAKAACLQIPTLLLVAGEDELVDPSGSRDFAAAAPPSLVTLHEFPGLYHELFNEAEPARSEVLNELAIWLKSLETRYPARMVASR
ncbi:alpha/beta hydrolase [Silvimonas soli]|uniref:alpha/beta hydrolase n=1 Tax=Silvimonas soli TaxID=2980100 RepID=UPI0024B391A4|nr:alpha/beta hydrolase [Silvimonas soli]